MPQGAKFADNIQSDLKGLAGAFSKAKEDPNMDHNNPDHVKQAMGGQQQAKSAVSSLLSAYKQHTGQEYTGNETENKVLSEVAHKVTSTDIPPSMLGTMAKNMI